MINGYKPTAWKAKVSDCIYSKALQICLCYFTMKVKKKERVLEFEVLRAVYVKDPEFWVMSQGTQIEMYRIFGGIRWFYLTFIDGTSVSHRNLAKLLRFNMALERRKQYCS